MAKRSRKSNLFIQLSLIAVAGGMFMVPVSAATSAVPGQVNVRRLLLVGKGGEAHPAADLVPVSGLVLMGSGGSDRPVQGSVRVPMLRLSGKGGVAHSARNRVTTPALVLRGKHD